jgi:hypothetical protein
LANPKFGQTIAESHSDWQSRRGDRGKEILKFRDTLIQFNCLMRSAFAENGNAFRFCEQRHHLFRGCKPGRRAGLTSFKPIDPGFSRRLAKFTGYCICTWGHVWYLLAWTIRPVDHWYAADRRILDRPKRSFLEHQSRVI